MTDNYNLDKDTDVRCEVRCEGDDLSRISIKHYKETISRDSFEMSAGFRQEDGPESSIPVVNLMLVRY